MSDGTQSIRWRSGGDQGLEQAVLKISATGIAAEGVIIAGQAETGYGLRYRIVIDAEWAGLRSLHITRLGGQTVALRHDGYGEWSDGEGKKRPEFSKCLDVVLDGSPLALSVTLKRMSWKAGKSQELPVLAIAAPSLELSRGTMKVTALEPGKRYKVEIDGGAAEEIEIDDSGFVRTYGERLTRA